MNKKMRKILLLIFMVLLFALCGCKSKEKKYTILLDDAFSVKPYVNLYMTKTEYNKIVDELTANLNKILNDLDSKYDYDDENSLLYKVNSEAYDDYVQVDEEFITILEEACFVSSSVSEKYDISIYPLVELWNFRNNYYDGIKIGEIPQNEAILSTLEKVDYKSIKIDGTRVKFDKIGMKIDLGSIVKGYAANLIVKTLKDYNVKSGIVNIGGNVITFGNRLFKVGIKAPLFIDDICFGDGLIGYINISNQVGQTFVTSGIYERYIKDENGNIYHHILDKNTGKPIDNDLLSVTIISIKDNYSSSMADALSTAVFTLGLDEGLDYIKKSDYEAVFVTKDKRIVISDGLKDVFVFDESAIKDGFKYE